MGKSIELTGSKDILITPELLSTPLPLLEMQIKWNMCINAHGVMANLTLFVGNRSRAQRNTEAPS